MKVVELRRCKLKMASSRQQNDGAAWMHFPETNAASEVKLRDANA
jgi:hypothetical protein